MANWKIYLTVILLLGFILRFLSIQYPGLHHWDEKYHALVARNCIEHPLQPMLYDRPLLSYEYRDWTQNHIWLHKQPFPIWVMASFLAGFGIDEIVLRLPSLILSLISIYLTFLIARQLYNKTVGLIASFLHSSHWLTIELVGGWTATDHYDVFFVVLIELSVFLFLKFSRSKSYFLLAFASISLSLAILTKWLTALFVLAVWWSFELLPKPDKEKFYRLIPTTLICSITVLAMILPWQLYTATSFPEEYQWESQYNFMHLIKSLEGHEQDWSFHIQYMGFHYGELVYLAILFILIRIFRSRKKASDVPIFLWIIIPYIFFTVAKTKMQAYTLIASPAIFIATASFVEFLFGNDIDKRLKPMAWIVGLSLLIVPVFRTIERGSLRLAEISNAEVINYSSWNFTSSTVVFNYPNPVEAMFYQDALVYSKIPSAGDLNKALQEGFEVVVVDDPKIPDSLRNNKDITIRSNLLD